MCMYMRESQAENEVVMSRADAYVELEVEVEAAAELGFCSFWVLRSGPWSKGC